jgi:hypothetical protein
MVFLKREGKIFISFWVLFFVFIFANCLLAYESLSGSAKGWIFIFGLILPWIAGISSRKSRDSKALFYTETFSMESPKLVFILLAAALFLRFYHLTHFYLWPNGDESLHGFLAIPLITKWDWQFFYTVGEHPPLLIWSLVPLFKFFNSPFFNLWFFPAIFSFIAVPTGYWASRQYFSKSFSLLFGFLLAFSFWPLYFGRFCHQGIFTPFWELSGFLLSAFFIKAHSERRKMIFSFCLGLWIGLGSLTFTAWVAVILLFVLTAVAVWFYRYRPSLDYLIGFFSGLLVGLLPFITAAFQNGYGHHLVDASSASHYFSFSHEMVTHLSYVTCLFWGSLQTGSSYAPVWGGMLNPLLGSCFFIGTIELFDRWNEKITLWIVAAFMILFLPGLLSADYVEFNRVIQVMPVVLLVTVLGLQRLAANLPNNRKWVLIPLLSVSFLLDMNQLLKPAVDGPAWNLNFKKEIPDENFLAYQILNNEYSKAGPGLVFTDFMPLTHGHSLHVTTYHFNAALNPKLNVVEAKWIGLMVNVHYQSFLEKRFPGSKWTTVTPVPPGQGGSVVGVIPITPENIQTFIKWNQVHQYFYQLNLQAENMYNDPKLYQYALQHFSDGYPLVKGDPFLESCFGEWVTQFHWGADHQANIFLMKQALQVGYPCAHLFYKLGQFLYLDNRFSEAKKAFQKAVRCPINETDSADWIKAINQITLGNKGK